LKTIHLIAAARPNFMKVAPLYHALKATDWANPVLVHTGQHYDHNMSDAILQDLKVPAPDFHLGVGSGSHAEQTGGVMIAYEKICLEHRPDWIVVVGDVNSTAACAMVGTRLASAVATAACPKKSIALSPMPSRMSCGRHPRTAMRI
jgi:UDP-N-acetylglucosamine 2-epimerase (non-hydrolysing)